MNHSTKLSLNILQVIAWIIFIGLCVDAGALLFSTYVIPFVSPDQAKLLWREIDLSPLHTFNPVYYFFEAMFISAVALLKAWMFYLIVKLLSENKLNFTQPFNNDVGRFIFNMAVLTLSIGVLSVWGIELTEWFASQGVPMPDFEKLRLEGADVWIFMSVTLFVISQIFKRGIELQSENDLTI